MPEGRETGSELIDALITRLREMPASDPRARAAILARVRGRRQSPWRATLAWAWQPSVPLLAAATIVVAALGVGYAGRVLVEPMPADEVASAPGGNTLAVVAVSNSEDLSGTLPVAQTFVLKAPGANRVALVGDFNGWGDTPTVMADPTGRGVWEVTVPLVPGRHTYAFLVNDSVWTLDPRMPQEQHPDFGTLSSVILVTEKR